MIPLAVVSRPKIASSADSARIRFGRMHGRRNFFYSDRDYNDTPKNPRTGSRKRRDGLSLVAQVACANKMSRRQQCLVVLARAKQPFRSRWPELRWPPAHFVRLRLLTLADNRAYARVRHAARGEALNMCERRNTARGHSFGADFELA